MDIDLKNRKVVITGASDGIGRSLALAFGEAGAHVAGCARNSDRLHSIEKEIDGKSVKGYGFQTAGAKDRVNCNVNKKIDNIPCINQKALWVSKWLNGNQNLLTRLIGFGLVEGLFFAGSFCAIYYFRKRGLLPGLALSNDWIARDEGMHFSFSSLMFKILRDKYNNGSLSDSDVKDLNLITGNVSQPEFEEIVREAVSFEKEFVTAALPVDLIGMNKKLMCQYIEAVADRIADLFDFERVFNTENPFDFMRALDVQNVTNFFEKRVSEYQRPTDRALSFDEAF